MRSENPGLERYCAEIVSDGSVEHTECFITVEKAEAWANTVLSDMETWRIRDKMKGNRVVKEMD